MVLGTLALLLTDASTTAAAAEPTVRVEREQETIRLEAEMFVTADVAVVWSVLTDYNRLAEFVPGMHESRIVSRPGQPLLVQQKGRFGFLLFSAPVQVVIQVEETPLQAVRFRAVGGNVTGTRGEWTLRPHDHATRVNYQATIVPDFWVPPFIGLRIVSRDVRDMIGSVAHEMQRRETFDAMREPPPAR